MRQQLRNLTRPLLRQTSQGAKANTGISSGYDNGRTGDTSDLSASSGNPGT